jgi:transcriptional regulator with XRE-family HTH domain
MNYGHLRKLWELRNYTQEYVAAELGISQNAYSMLENGKTAMKVDQLLLLAKVLDTDPNELLSTEPFVVNINNGEVNVENGGTWMQAQTMHNEQKEEINFLKNQIAEKDRQIQSLMQLLQEKAGQ